MSEDGTEAGEARRGLLAAIGSYVVWGVLPVYLYFVLHIPVAELVGWRVIFTLPICLVMLAALRSFGSLRRTLANPVAWRALLLSSVLIGLNWFIYILAVQAGHVLATSLGYYISPILTVLLGALVLKEPFGRRGWLAVFIAAAGVVVLLAGALETLWISVSLAASFAIYGLVRKVAPVGAVEGLTIETLIWMLPSIALVAWYATSPEGSSMGAEPLSTTLLMLSGSMTAVPLLLFIYASKRMDYATIGFLQYLAPTLGFIIGLTLYGDRLEASELVSFALIWVSIAIYCWDLFERRRARRAQAPA